MIDEAVGDDGEGHLQYERGNTYTPPVRVGLLLSMVKPDAGDGPPVRAGGLLFIGAQR